SAYPDFDWPDSVLEQVWWHALHSTHTAYGFITKTGCVAINYNDDYNYYKSYEDRSLDEPSRQRPRGNCLYELQALHKAQPRKLPDFEARISAIHGDPHSPRLPRAAAATILGESYIPFLRQWRIKDKERREEERRQREEERKRREAEMETSPSAPSVTPGL